MLNKVLGAIVLLPFLTLAASAQNARNCVPREAAIERLTTGYGETRRAIGLGPNNQVVEVFASEETGTWTITVTLPNGVTCLVASGQNFEELYEALPSESERL